MEDGSLWRIQVFGFGIIHHAPAESNDLPANVNDGEHNAVPEAVVHPAAFAAGRKAGVQNLFFGKPFFAHGVQQSGKPIGRIA